MEENREISRLDREIGSETMSLTTKPLRVGKSTIVSLNRVFNLLFMANDSEKNNSVCKAMLGSFAKALEKFRIVSFFTLFKSNRIKIIFE